MEFDFSPLEENKELHETLLKFDASIDKIEEIVNNPLSKEEYEKLSTYDKAQYDIFTAYMLNSLFWIYLRTKDVDPNDNDVKKELGRLKEYMINLKKAHERNTIRPVIDKAAAGRFIKHGIHYKDKKQSDSNVSEPQEKQQKSNL